MMNSGGGSSSSSTSHSRRNGCSRSPVPRPIPRPARPGTNPRPQNPRTPEPQNPKNPKTQNPPALLSYRSYLLLPRLQSKYSTARTDCKWWESCWCRSLTTISTPQISNFKSKCTFGIIFATSNMFNVSLFCSFLAYAMDIRLYRRNSSTHVRLILMLKCSRSPIRAGGQYGPLPFSSSSLATTSPPSHLQTRPPDHRKWLAKCWGKEAKHSSSMAPQTLSRA